MSFYQAFMKSVASEVAPMCKGYCGSLFVSASYKEGDAITVVMANYSDNSHRTHKLCICTEKDFNNAVQSSSLKALKARLVKSIYDMVILLESKDTGRAPG